MTIEIKKVECINIDSIPNDNETIADDFDIPLLVSAGIKQIEIYLRDKAACPFNRGNWLIDIKFYNDEIFSIKLPKDMQKNKVHVYVKPLLDALKEKDKKDMH